MINKVTFIGSGNVASQLAIAFNQVNIKIQQILSRNNKTGKILAKKVNADFISNFTQYFLIYPFLASCQV